MPITLGSNIASLKSQRRLADGTAALSKSFERLSSGQRINRASDDAAGLAIADSLNARSRIFNQGVRNLGDGLSLLSIADSAIETLSGIMIRLEELAEQSANGVYSNEQRKALDAEAQALSDEFFRVSKTTEFNGQKLFTGETPLISIQAGVGENAVINTSVGGAIGTGEFGAATSFSVGDGPTSVVTGDFNEDGILDLVTANFNDDSVSVLLGTGNGSFAAAKSFGVGNEPSSLVTGDFNGDGILDLVTAHFNDDSASVLLGTGNGSFAAAISVAVVSGPSSLAIGDFNVDGVLDLVASSAFDNTASVLLGMGDGSFGSSTSFTLGFLSPGAVTTGDFNGDGVLDLVTAGYGIGFSETVSVLLGTGDGSFGGATSFFMGNMFLNSVATDDFNGDGVLDLATADASNMVSVAFGLGDGSFGVATDLAGDRSTSVTTGDFNGDGIIDLGTTYRNGDTVSVFLGEGDGNFAAAISFAVGDGPDFIASGDFDGDGVLDLASASYTGSSLSVLIGEKIEGVAPILPFSLRTLADARQSLPVFQRKREQLAAQRGEIGAFQSRIGVAANVLTVSSENFRAAESRIRDTDIADESSRLVRLNILQQAASSILAQANQQPTLALQLLRGR